MGLDDLFDSMGHNRHHNKRKHYDEHNYDERETSIFNHESQREGHYRKESSMGPHITLFLEKLRSDRKLQILLALIVVVGLICFTVVVVVAFKMLGGAAGFLSNQNIPSGILEWVKTFLPVLGN